MALEEEQEVCEVPVASSETPCPWQGWIFPRGNKPAEIRWIQESGSASCSTMGGSGMAQGSQLSPWIIKPAERCFLPSLRCGTGLGSCPFAAGAGRERCPFPPGTARTPGAGTEGTALSWVARRSLQGGCCCRSSGSVDGTPWGPGGAGSVLGIDAFGGGHRAGRERASALRSPGSHQISSQACSQVI